MLIFAVDCQTDCRCSDRAALHHLVVGHLDAYLGEEVLLGAYHLEVDHLVAHLVVRLDAFHLVVVHLALVHLDVVVTFDSDLRLKVLPY